MSQFSKFIEYGVFPITLSVGVILVYQASMNNVDHGLVIGSCSLLALVIIAIVERVQPFRKSWNQSQQDIATDIGHNLLSSYAPRETDRLPGQLFWGVISVASAQLGLWSQQWRLWANRVLPANR